MISQNHIDLIRQWLFIAMFSFPVVPIKLINAFFIAFTVITLSLFIKEKSKWFFSDFKYYLIFIVPFIPYLIELVLFPTNQIIRFEAEKKLLFFIAPVSFYLNSLLNHRIKLYHAINCFISSVAILSIVSFFYLVFAGHLFSVSSYQNGAFELRKSFEEISGQHPIYFGLFCSTASLWVIYAFDQYSKNLKWLLGVSLFFMITLNFLIAAKMPLLIFVVGVLWIAFKKVENKKRLISFYSLFFVSLFLMVEFIPSLNNRLSEVISFFDNVSNNNTILERYVVFNCSKMVFVQDFLTGIGSRNTQNLLDFCYVYFKFYKGYSIHLNSHNQYLTIGISYGIGVLIVFVACLSVLFKLVKKSPYGFIYLVSSSLIMLTESILERQMGIYYFLFFGLLFLSTTYNKKETIANPQ